jgi:ribosomal protein S18 acetylase RimI-like enzyme
MWITCAFTRKLREKRAAKNADESSNVNQTSPRIIRATEADLTQIAILASVIWRMHYPGIISTEQIDYMLAKMYSLEVLREEILTQGICFERLLLGDEFAGFASYGPTNEVTIFKLHKIYLHPSWHNRGLGSLLLRHCEGEAARLGAERLLLAVNKQNFKAIAAYQRNGFAITESVVTNIGGGFAMDDFIMIKELKM